MGINIFGSVLVEVESNDAEDQDERLEELEIDANDFSLEESGRRNLGEGEYQYEALYIYSDPQQRFQVSFEAVESDRGIRIYPLGVEVFSGEVSLKIVENNIEADFVETDEEDDD